MMVFLTLLYCAVLFLLVKLKVIRLNTFWKASPLIWALLLFIVLFLPMQWGAPAGTVSTYQYVIEIIPNVTGEVIEVPAKPLVPIQRGEVLFKIDPVPFQASVDDLEARLRLAETRLRQSKELAAAEAGSEYDVEKYAADVDQLNALLESANYNLTNTMVRAPADGWILGLTLQPGQRVSNLTIQGWMPFVVDTRRLIVGINQSQIRHVAPGQDAEVVLKLFPGKTLKAKVVGVAPMIPQGQLAPSGVAPSPPNASMVPGPYGVLLELDDERISIDQVYGGALGTAAIYTDSVKATHVIRKVMLRMEAWINYVSAL
jgi:multidrug resistance efflux pump